ncbi:MAG: type VI secretion system-associated protein TagF [Nitrospirales bacterium]
MLEKISLEVGCFGKLPLSPEFIRVNAKGSALQAFDQWLQEGLHGYRTSTGPNWIQDYLQSETWNFLFHDPGGSECLVGVVTPNQDKAGRGFPMSIFLRIEATEFAGKIQKVPVYFQTFLARAKQMVEEGWKDHSLQEFREQISGWEIPDPGNWDSLDRLFQEFLGAYSMNELLHLCGVQKDLFLSVDLKVHMQERVRAMVTAHRPTNPSKGGQLMSFPLIHDPALPFEIPFWMEYLKKYESLTFAYPILFWNKSPQNSHAVVFLQNAPVSPKSFAKLIHPLLAIEPYWPLVSESRASDEDDQGGDVFPQMISPDSSFPEEQETLEGLLR